MAKFKPIYDNEIPDRARIIWSFLTLIPLAVIVAASAFTVLGLRVGYLIASGAATNFAEAKEVMQSMASGGMDPFIMVLPFAFFIIYSALWVRLVEGRPLSTMGIGSRLWLPRYIVGFIVGMLFLVVILGAIYKLGGYKIDAMLPVFSAPDPVNASLIIVTWLIMFPVQGAGEEFVFRGWWMSALASRRGKLIALMAPSVFFGIAHLGNVWPPITESLIGCANVVLFGIFIGLYALKEKSLWGACGWHSAWNWLLGLGFGLEVSGLGVDATPLLVDLADADGASILITGGSFGPEASLVTTGVLILGSLWFVMRGALKD